MFEATVTGMLGGLLGLAALWSCNKIVTWIEKGMRRERGVTGYEIHESFQQRQAKRHAKARRSA